jgi:hypothetical protein
MPRSCAQFDAVAPQFCDQSVSGISPGWVLAWLLLVLGGGLPLWIHLTSPGDAGRPPELWPATTDLERNSDGPTLLLFAHPQCPCTRASLSELAAIVVRTEATVTVVFHRPAGAPPAWRDAPLVQQARGLTRVRVVWDDTGRVRRAFGVQTSGHALVYDGRGRLQYSGGITAGRGHAGDNAGRTTALACLQSTEARISRLPVFGCPLAASESHCRSPDTRTLAGGAP